MPRDGPVPGVDGVDQNGTIATAPHRSVDRNSDQFRWSDPKLVRIVQSGCDRPPVQSGASRPGSAPSGSNNTSTQFCPGTNARSSTGGQVDQGESLIRRNGQQPPVGGGCCSYSAPLTPATQLRRAWSGTRARPRRVSGPAPLVLPPGNRTPSRSSGLNEPVPTISNSFWPVYRPHRHNRLFQPFVVIKSPVGLRVAATPPRLCSIKETRRPRATFPPSAP